MYIIYIYYAIECHKFLLLSLELVLCFELGDIISDVMISEDSIETADVTIAFDDNNNNFSAHRLGWWLDELELRPT